MVLYCIWLFSNWSDGYFLIHFSIQFCSYAHKFDRCFMKLKCCFPFFDKSRGSPRKCWQICRSEPNFRDGYPVNGHSETTVAYYSPKCTWRMWTSEISNMTLEHLIFPKFKSFPNSSIEFYTWKWFWSLCLVRMPAL